MAELTFLRLNLDWNADPNDPAPKIEVVGQDLHLSFYLNRFAYAATESEKGSLGFTGVRRWRWDQTNDHAWYGGNGRYSRQAPRWGEFYEILGDDASMDRLEWHEIQEVIMPSRHFLFYLRDECFECQARDWIFDRG